MRWNLLACGFLLTPLALSVQAAPPALAHDGYRLRELSSGSGLQRWEREPGAAAAACAPLPPAPAASAGSLAVIPLVKDRFFNKFFQGGGRLYRLVTQQHGEPRAIVIHSGAWTLPRLLQGVSGQPDVLVHQGDHYLLRVPLLLENGASLVVRDGEELRLGRESGAFILSMGTLHLHKARLVAWEEEAGKPSEAPADGARFQPFVVAWSGSRTLIADSTLAGLGFAENLAQGLTLAVGPQGLAGYKLPPPASVSIQDSHFNAMYSAVHASAIPEVALCRNEFVDSRLHAVHLDEGASGLLLRNHITATQGAYGIYFNKGVHDVRVLENDISENRRSGISISGARDIVIADNEIRQNFDALFLQDSDRIALARNHILDNQRHGISLRNVGRVRLNGDQIGPNRGVGLLAQPAGKPTPRPEAKPVGTVTRGPDPELGAGRPVVAAAVAYRVDGNGASAGAKREMSGSGNTAGSPATPHSPPLVPAGQASSPARGTDGSVPASSSLQSSQANWRPPLQRIEMVDVLLEGNHSSALVIEKPYSVLFDKVSVMYPGVRRRPVFRGVLNQFESDILQRLLRKRTLLVEPSTHPALPSTAGH